MILNFFVDYIPSDENQASLPITDIQLIAIRYLKSGFLLDLIPLLPIGNIITDINDNNNYKLFYLLKQLRMMKSIELLDITFVIQQLKERSKHSL
tara:strand:+ start:314 stop:598 length:285 start_codon:yes stop_codon:yes gene_type:complete